MAPKDQAVSSGRLTGGTAVRPQVLGLDTGGWGPCGAVCGRAAPSEGSQSLLCVSVPNFSPFHLLFVPCTITFTLTRPCLAVHACCPSVRGLRKEGPHGFFFVCVCV